MTDGTTALGSWTRPKERTFFAGVWKRLDKKSLFYIGNDSHAVGVPYERSLKDLADPLSEHTKGTRCIGNSSGHGKGRHFDSSIDDVRIDTPTAGINFELKDGTALFAPYSFLSDALRHADENRH